MIAREKANKITATLKLVVRIKKEQNDDTDTTDSDVSP